MVGSKATHQVQQGEKKHENVFTRKNDPSLALLSGILILKFGDKV